MSNLSIYLSICLSIYLYGNLSIQKHIRTYKLKDTIHLYMYIFTQWMSAKNWALDVSQRSPWG